MKMSLILVLFVFGIVFSHCAATSTYQSSECALSIQENGMELLRKGIEIIDPNIEIAGRFHEALSYLYHNVDRMHLINTTKTYLRNITSQYNGITYSAESTFGDREYFDERYVYLYTTLAVYKKLNRILREHDCTSKTLSDEELYYAPYSAIFLSVLMYSPNLTEYKGTTYRGVNLTESDINQYSVDTRFVWNQFTSTSSNETMAFVRNVTFIINNDNFSPYMGPKLVRIFAWKEELDEVVYGPGAEFQVVRVEKYITGSVGSATITLKTVESTRSAADRSRRMHIPNAVVLLLIIFCV